MLDVVGMKAGYPLAVLSRRRDLKPLGNSKSMTVTGSRIFGADQAM